MSKDPRDALQSWTKELRERHRPSGVGAKDVRLQLGECIHCFSFWDVSDLIDIEPAGGVYVCSSSEAHSQEQQMHFQRLRKWLKHLDMRFVGGSGEEMKAFIPQVTPAARTSWRSYAL